ncbi:hypothetical protein OSSY52_08930 [Tepiditoga spiralis]|uniref:Uncharacterized protein n=1 Tax=Tepiditoga spiralis TaxID=2108365 RepID=A0A7G1G9L4_9BACT|nr:hypothetical protein [Tepiditoga spiralis]BBE30752.1 hypothetical protein OSSY52_08930 [Tepiditoga spiralis]
MKNSLLFLIIILSIFISIINFSNDTFYFISMLVVALTGFYGFFSNIKLWYHKSSHIIVSSLIGIILGGYELLKYGFGWLGVLTGNAPPALNIGIILFGTFSIFILYYEKKTLDKKKSDTLTKE